MGFVILSTKNKVLKAFATNPPPCHFFFLIFFSLNVIVIIINTYSKPNVSVFLLFNLKPIVSLSFVKHIPTELSATPEPSPARTLLGAPTFDEEWEK